MTSLKNPCVTVIVPVYNVQDYIRECITSIQNQSYTNLDILIINDGTKDKSIDIIRDLIDSDDRIRVIDQLNQGLSAARNTGIENAKGDYIAMVDSDDRIKRYFIEQLLVTAQCTNADIVRGSFRDFDGNIPKGWVADFKTPIVTTGADVLDEFLDNNASFVVWSSLYKTEFLINKKLRFIPGILLEDGDFTSRAYLKADTVVTTNFRDYQYRIRPGSILTTNNAQRMSDSEALVIRNFIELHESVSDVHTKHIIAKAIYAFIRDWTRILSKNKVVLNDYQKDIYSKALDIVEIVNAQRTIKERLKFGIKKLIIKFKY
jgi:glycosyltransferase involved in cell wall biosynthesis